MESMMAAVQHYIFRILSKLKIQTFSILNADKGRLDRSLFILVLLLFSANTNFKASNGLNRDEIGRFIIQIIRS